MHLDKLKDELTPEGYILAISAIANWCNGNISGCSRQRMAERRKAAESVNQPGDATHEETTNLDEEEQHLDNGLAKRMSPFNRGSIFASIRLDCIHRGEELNLQGQFDPPKNFEDYIKAQLLSLRKNGISENDIRNHMKKNLGITEADARSMALKGLNQRIAQITNEMEDLIALDKDYDSSIDPEEAEQTLGKSGQHRMRVKLIDSFMYRAAQMLTPIGQYNGQFADQLSNKRRDYLDDAVKMEDELKVFEEKFGKQINAELDDRSEITVLNRENKNTLDRFRKQVKEQREIEIAAEMRRIEVREKLQG